MEFLITGMFGLIIISFIIYLLYILHTDAVARGKSGLLVVLLTIFIAFPASLLLWLCFRPPFIEKETSADSEPVGTKGEEMLERINSETL